MASRMVLLALAVMAVAGLWGAVTAESMSGEMAPLMNNTGVVAEDALDHDKFLGIKWPKVDLSCTIRCGFAHACQFNGGNCAFPKGCVCDDFAH
ncbi:hypothetical protein RvY_14904-2 [Ramazzottius varieornatus]|uniref:Invertebrate defensins family profile domain-containing protein n=1 Tax=Ramazzottius varieornatus TaxID=947166 RepID=A0A1D1VUM3_RAMVA|nr:hypothetical protein RvY_14904-2 [Ramazzottius varieornatus]